MTFTPDNAVVWTEIPVRDIDRGIAFYSQVFDFDMTKDESGPNPMAMCPVKDLATGTAGHIYPGEPAAPGTGPTVHIQVPDSLEPAVDRFEKSIDKSVPRLPPRKWCSPRCEPGGGRRTSMTDSATATADTAAGARGTPSSSKPGRRRPDTVPTDRIRH